MRLLLFFFCLLTFAKTLSSQDQYSFVKEESTWINEEYQGDGGILDQTNYSNYRFAGDTLIDGLHYLKLWVNNIYVGAMREADKRVYHHQYGKIDTVLDFNLSVNDTLISDHCPGGSCGTMVLEKIDTVQLLDGSMRKRLNFQAYNLGDYELDQVGIAWIDGIGSTRGLPLSESCFVLERSLSSPSCGTKLLCFESAGALLFTNRKDPLYSCSPSGVVSSLEEEELASGLIQIFPNPVRNQLEIRLEQTTNFRLNRLQIVDALGRVKALVEQPRQAFSINTTQWLAGTYYLRLIRNDREVLVRPIVKL